MAHFSLGNPLYSRTSNSGPEDAIFSNDKDLDFLQQNWYKTKFVFIQNPWDFKIIKSEPVGVSDHVSLSTTNVRPRNSL